MLPHPLLLGHRGVPTSGSVHENSIAAFDRALKQGCDGFELDIRLTGCGRMVICHDAKVGKVFVSRAKHSQLPDLARLEDVLRRYGRRSFLDIELKVKGLETRLLAALRENPPEREYVISSFLPEVLLELKARSALVPVGIICRKPSQLVAWRKLPVEYVIVHQSLINRRLVQLIHDSGRKLFAWTVNSRPAMLRLNGWGVDGIISDKTELLVDTLARRQVSTVAPESALRLTARASLHRRARAS